MNPYKQLHRNNYGVSFYCQCQKQVHLTFGNVALAQTKGEFDAFCNELKLLLAENQNICPYRKCLVLRTPVSKIALIFNLVEIKELLDLMENSKIALEIMELLQS